MKKMELKSRKLLRRIFGGISLTAVAFAFHACYGVPNKFYDVKLSGTVTSKMTNLPIKGIEVALGYYERGFTNENGEFDFYARVPGRPYYDQDGEYCTPDNVRVHFRDIDGIENGHFSDTTIIIDPAYKAEVKIHVELAEK